MSAEEAIRERIMLKAQELFLAQGYSQVTMSEIAVALGMSKKTLYKFFENKQDLLISVVNTVMSALERQFEALMQDQEIEFLEKLRTILAIGSAAQGGISNAALKDLKRHAPEAWDYIHNWRNSFIRNSFAKFFEEGIQKGFLRSDLNREIAIEIYTYAMESILHISATNKQPYPMREIFDTFLEIFYVGVFTDNARMNNKLQKVVFNRVQSAIPGTVPPISHLREPAINASTVPEHVSTPETGHMA